jgi:hypothetical protein
MEIDAKELLRTLEAAIMIGDVCVRVEDNQLHIEVETVMPKKVELVPTKIVITPHAKDTI